MSAEPGVFFVPLGVACPPSGARSRRRPLECAIHHHQNLGLCKLSENPCPCKKPIKTTNLLFRRGCAGTPVHPPRRMNPRTRTPVCSLAQQPPFDPDGLERQGSRLRSSSSPSCAPPPFVIVVVVVVAVVRRRRHHTRRLSPGDVENSTCSWWVVLSGDGRTRRAETDSRAGMNHTHDPCPVQCSPLRWT